MRHVSNPIRLLLALTAAVSLSAPAFAAPSSAAVKTQIEQQLSQVQNLIASHQLENLPAQLRLAQASFKQLEGLKDVDSLDQNKWKVTEALRQNLIFTHLGAAQALYDSGKYATSLEVLADARTLDPKLPVTYYFEAMDLLKQGKEWDATEKLYQAKRLNFYPALRKVENPLQPWEVLSANPNQLDARIDTALKSLGKDTDYPITLNFQTGQHTDLKLIPGVGANLMGRDGKTFNVYLDRDMINKVLNNMGKPVDIQQKYMRKQMLTFNIYDDYFIIGMNPENIIERIQVDKPGYSVEVDSHLYKIGDSVAQLQKDFGERFGFEKIAGDDPRFKETWVYNDLGLSIGITPDQRIGLISIWNLE